jgi:hypothetical protein
LQERRTEENFNYVVQLVAEKANTELKSIEVDEEANTLKLKIGPVKINELAALNVVKVVNKRVSKVLCNDFARNILGCQALSSPRSLTVFPFGGEGQTIAIADTGLDTSDIHDISPAFEGRITKLISINRVQQNNRTNDVYGYSTHMCGSAVGAAVPLATVHKHIQGTAPKASLVMQSLYYSMKEPIRVPTDSALQSLFLDPYNQYGAFIHSNSWSNEFDLLKGQQAYSAKECKLVDDLVHANPDLLIIIAARNDRKQTDGLSISSISACKNVLTVGAIESYRPSINSKVSKTKLSENNPSEVS